MFDEGRGKPFGKRVLPLPSCSPLPSQNFCSGLRQVAQRHRRKKMGSPPDGMGRRQILFSTAKAPGQNDRALLQSQGEGPAGLASSTACHAIHLGSWRADIQGQDDAGYFVSCTNGQTRGARSVSGRAPRIWRPRIRRRGPACRSEKEVLEGRGEGRPGAALRAVPVTTKEGTGIESWLEGEPFLEKVFLPRCLACAFYSWARPMPGRAASRPAPRRKRPASSKALPMSCMPTGILLSAAMPTGRDRPGRPARFRDRV